MQPINSFLAGRVPVFYSSHLFYMVGFPSFKVPVYFIWWGSHLLKFPFCLVRKPFLHHLDASSYYILRFKLSRNTFQILHCFINYIIYLFSQIIIYLFSFNIIIQFSKILGNIFTLICVVIEFDLPRKA